MILVDTSAWIEFDRATQSPTHHTLRELIALGREVAVSEPVLAEVLAGARDESAASQLRRMLTSVLWIPSNAQVDFEAGATIYRQCRAKGITPRSLIDCVIAAITLRTKSEVLAADRDFEAIAQVVPLRLYQPPAA